MDKACPALIVFLKCPRPGTVKTRLARIIGDEKATQVYRDFIATTFVRLQSLDALFALLAAYSPPHASPSEFKSLVPYGIPLFPQTDGDLGERMAHALEYDSFPGRDAALLVGTDSPDLPLSYVLEGRELLEKNQVVLGPTWDGGFYLIGVQKGTPLNFLLGEVRWGGNQVLETICRNIEEMKLSLAFLKPWYDVDSSEDLHFLKLRLRYSLEEDEALQDLALSLS